MTSYSLNENSNGEIVFWTDNSELKNNVVDVIGLIVDGVSWRNRIERLSTPPICEENGK